MRALTYHGARDVRFETVPIACTLFPEAIVSHRMQLDDAAAGGYSTVDKQEGDCHQVVLTPEAPGHPVQ